MKYFKKLIISLLGGIIVFLILGWGYNIVIGKPITLSHYFSIHKVSYMKISLCDNEGKSLKSKTLKSKELSKEEIDLFLKQFGSYKIFKPFFRRTFIAKQDKSCINIFLGDKANNLVVAFPLTDQGGVNLERYTFYPYNAEHKDMYNYLLDLLGSS